MSFVTITAFFLFYNTNITVGERSGLKVFPVIIYCQNPVLCAPLKKMLKINAIPPLPAHHLPRGGYLHWEN